MSIATRLRSVLDLKGLTIKQAGDVAGIPYRTLQNYLLEEREPNAKAMSALRTHLGISADWLLTGEGEMLTLSGGISVSAAPSTAEAAILEGLRVLNDDDQRDLLRIVEGMKRYRQMENEVRKLKLALADAKGPA